MKAISEEECNRLDRVYKAHETRRKRLQRIKEAQLTDDEIGQIRHILLKQPKRKLNPKREDGFIQLNNGTLDYCLQNLNSSAFMLYCYMKSYVNRDAGNRTNSKTGEHFKAVDIWANLDKYYDNGNGYLAFARHQDVIAKDFGVNTRTILRGIRELQEHGFIKRVGVESVKRSRKGSLVQIDIYALGESINSTGWRVDWSTDKETIEKNKLSEFWYADYTSRM